MRAVERLLGNAAATTTMSSTKSSIGHLLGAAGAVEAIFSILAIRDQIAPPTLNLDNPSVETAIDLVPHVARKREDRRRAVEFLRLRRHQRVGDLQAGAGSGLTAATLHFAAKAARLALASEATRARMDEAANQGDKAKPGAAAQPAQRVSLFGGRANPATETAMATAAATARRRPSRRVGRAASACRAFPAC